MTIPITIDAIFAGPSHIANHHRTEKNEGESKSLKGQEPMGMRNQSVVVNFNWLVKIIHPNTKLEMSPAEFSACAVR